MNHQRHLGLYNLSHLSVMIVGCGGIGSMAALALSKMGVGKIAIVDFDIVSEENPTTQLYGVSDVGKPKVEALREIISHFGDDETEISISEEKISSSSDLSGYRVILAAVDGVEARKEVWRAAKKASPLYFLDSRMSSEEFHLYTVKMSDSEWYENALMSLNEDDIPDEPCTSKATTYTTMTAAGHIAWCLKCIASNERPPQYLFHSIKAQLLIRGSYGN